MDKAQAYELVYMDLLQQGSPTAEALAEVMPQLRQAAQKPSAKLVSLVEKIFKRRGYEEVDVRKSINPFNQRALRKVAPDVATDVINVLIKRGGYDPGNVSPGMQEDIFHSLKQLVEDMHAHWDGTAENAAFIIMHSLGAVPWLQVPNDDLLTHKGFTGYSL